MYPATPWCATRSARRWTLLPLLGCHRIAFPSIGSGVAGIPHETVAAEMMEALATTLLATDESYAVELWLYDRYHQQRPEAYAELFVEHLQQTLGLRASVEGDSTSFVPPADEATHRAHAAYEMLRKLDARRAELEHRLVEALTSTSDDQTDVLATCRRQLDELRQLREGYEADLLRLTGQKESSASAQTQSVFLSSTYLDLKSHRESVKDVIQRCTSASSAWRTSPRAPSHRRRTSASQWSAPASTLAFSACATAILTRAPVAL